MTVTLHGMHFSVYVRVARLALAEKGVAYDLAEVNPFVETESAEHLQRHPFNRVPVLEHDGFLLHETAAITRYVDEAFAGPALQPTDARTRGRMGQVIGIVDLYGYWPMVRQVFSERISKPARGIAGDDAVVAAGLEGSEKCCEALENLVLAKPFLLGDGLTLADLHLAPMVDCFTRTPEGAACLARFEKLSGWWATMQTRESVIATRPTLWD